MICRCRRCNTFFEDDEHTSILRPLCVKCDEQEWMEEQERIDRFNRCASLLPCD